MNEVRLTVHRATHQIGGNCIEIGAADGHRIILDVGRPLDAPQGATGLLPKSLDVAPPVDGVLISHPHQDHYGLLEDVPAGWSVHAGEATARLIKLSSGMESSPSLGTFETRESDLTVLAPLRLQLNGSVGVHELAHLSPHLGGPRVVALSPGGGG